MYVDDREEYFSVFLEAAISATAPAFMAALSTQEAANGLTTVTSQTSERPPCQGIKVSPSGRFPSCLSSPDGSLTAGIPAAPKARQMMSLRTWCLAIVPGVLLTYLLLAQTLDIFGQHTAKKVDDTRTLK